LVENGVLSYFIMFIGDIMTNHLYSHFIRESVDEDDIRMQRFFLILKVLWKLSFITQDKKTQKVPKKI